MLHVEFLALPGSGKSTLFKACLNEPDHGIKIYDVDGITRRATKPVLTEVFFRKIMPSSLLFKMQRAIFVRTIFANKLKRLLATDHTLSEFIIKFGQDSKDVTYLRQRLRTKVLQILLQNFFWRTMFFYKMKGLSQNLFTILTDFPSNSPPHFIDQYISSYGRADVIFYIKCRLIFVFNECRREKKD